MKSILRGHGQVREDPTDEIHEKEKKSQKGDNVGEL